MTTHPRPKRPSRQWSCGWFQSLPRQRRLAGLAFQAPEKTQLETRCPDPPHKRLAPKTKATVAARALQSMNKLSAKTGDMPTARLTPNGAVFAHEFDGLKRPLDSGRLTTDDRKQNAFIFTLRYIDAFEATLKASRPLKDSPKQRPVQDRKNR